MLSQSHRGISTLGAIALASVIIIGGISLFIIYTARGQTSRDKIRQSHLQTIGLAQEYYYDRHRKYGDLSDLSNASLLPSEIKDPATGTDYQIYRNHLNDEWCAWVGSEAKKSLYFIYHEAGAGTITNQPTNLATCKPSL